ncbi:magnesium transporter [Wolbachia endosymbiont of Brugia malayi]|uniref:magnesium transporter n=1 Tax=unclassified Wolbachia TaxID=2640676 RepID=UPI00004C9334|nr:MULTISPECIES: magnesium transporter [unclassified Wolbachia]AAW70883.1 Mg/Co/Ni transporter MgtE [Wolbachia endosymbiont strain TRS of Brugia malayi]QCB61841.1 magnesium transporter [Wolbachia endosymbiont of Brugia malayi]QIT36170.1 magnesium transporter [Wolbachia endosymbiont of Brugia pahangi]
MSVETKFHYDLDKKAIDSLVESLNNQKLENIHNIIKTIDSVQLAYFLSTSISDHREQLVSVLDQYSLSNALVHVVPDLQVEIIETLGIENAAKLLTLLDVEDIVAIVKDLDRKSIENILKYLPNETQKSVEELLSYPEESAGRLIHKDMVIAPYYWTINQLTEFLRSYKKIPEKFHQIFIIDSKLEPIGSVNLNKVISHSGETIIKEIMSQDIKIIKTGVDQEEVARVFKDYSLLSAPVVNKRGKIIGVILIEDVIKVVQQETEEDVLKISGVSSKADINAPIHKTIIQRLPWLLFNLLAATICSVVVGFFDDIIKSFVVLPIVMPIITSMSGNAGSQTVTLTIRAIATKYLTEQNANRILIKEFFIGLINGIILSTISLMVLAIRFHSFKVEIIFVASMVMMSIIATFIGTFIPIMLHRLKSDPAVSSSILTSATTDILSAFIFLGLATLFLLNS